MKMDRRDFIKLALGGGFGALLVWLGALRSEEPDDVPPEVPEALGLRPAIYLCTPFLGYGGGVYGEYWDRPTSEILEVLERLEAIAQRSRQRLEEPWEAPIYTQVVRSPPVDARSGQPCPAIESSLVMGVGRRSAQIFTEPWGMEVKLGD